MINWYGSAVSVGLSLPPASHAAGAVNGAWVDVRNVKGELCVPISIGSLTGSVIFKLQDATDGSGTGAADLSPAVATTSINTGSSTAKLVVPANVIRSHVRVVATVTTGPVFAAAPVLAIPQII